MAGCIALRTPRCDFPVTLTAASALMDDGGVYVRAYADSMTITIEVPTTQLIDAATCLKDLDLI